MATTRFNNNILSAARRLNDPRTDASSTGDAGKRYLSALLADYQNRAVIDIVANAIKEMGIDKTVEIFPEFLKPSTALVMAGNAVAKPVDALAVVEFMKSDGSVYFTRRNPSDVQKIITGYDVLNVPSATDPIFWEEAGQIKTLPVEAAAWSVIARYIQCPADVTVVTGAGGTDLLINRLWDSKIVNMMVEWGLKDAGNWSKE